LETVRFLLSTFEQIGRPSFPLFLEGSHIIDIILFTKEGLWEKVAPPGGSTMGSKEKEDLRVRCDK